MKRAIILFLFLMATTSYIVYRAVTPNFQSVEGGKVDNRQALVCSTKRSRKDLLITSSNSSTRKLGELDEKCTTTSSSKLMLFTIMPKDKIEAGRLADEMAATLEEFHKYDIEPIVIVEPDSSWGLIDFSEFNTGFWDSWVQEFFKKLKENGISQEMMGTWVPFPEANLPYWNHQNSEPEEFSDAVNRYFSILKTYYPDVKGSILLNSATYPTDDFNWQEGEYISLKDYVSGLNKEYIDSIGIQGFPWISKANQNERILFDAKEYLSPKITKEAADIVGTKNIWFNTGSFASKYTNEPESRVIIVPEIRKKILESVLEVTSDIEKSGYNVSVNIFAQDKSETPEATDWAYWGTQYTSNTLHQTVIVSFLQEAQKQNIDVSFFLR